MKTVGMGGDGIKCGGRGGGLQNVVVHERGSQLKKG